MEYSLERTNKIMLLYADLPSLFEKIYTIFTAKTISWNADPYLSLITVTVSMIPSQSISKNAYKKFKMPRQVLFVENLQKLIKW